MNLNFSRLTISTLATVAVLGLSACGGGGGADATSASAPSPASTPVQFRLPGLLELPNMFLLFPNPQKQDDGTIQTNTAAYATAYYAAIDPANERATKAAFLTKNGFGNSATGTEKTVVFGDTKDLGYGRRMIARHNNDGTMAFYIDNYVVDLGGAYGYSTLNVDAAVVQLASRFFGTNAIEYSPSPTGGPNLVKFYNYAPDGTRNLVADLDGLGDKAMPHICTNCHGGRADPLTPAGLFPIVGNSVSQKRGDVQGRLQPLKVSTFDYSTLDAAFTRSAQEANLKTINKWILESYPLPAPSVFPEDANRPVAGLNEWQGTAAATLIKDAYGGNNLPNATYTPPPPPTAWVSAGQTSLYQSAVEPSCITCHVLRGTANQSEIDFTTYAKFFAYSDRIKAHVFDRGNMPLAKIVYNEFWEPGSVMPGLFATFLESPSQVLAPAPYTVRSGGTILTPGRPIADPGPDRVVPQGAITLSATGSLYAASFAWSLVSENGGPVSNATLTNASSASPTFSATANGTYTVQLVATNSGGNPSSPSLLTIVVDNALSPAPSTIRFSDIKAIFTSAGCNACHVQPLTAANKPPVSYSAADYVDDATFYADVRGRINFTDIVASPLLRKPSGHHHSGGAIGGFDDTTAPGNTLRTNYDVFLNWILSGAPRT